jgi:hypothetical protein
MEHFDMRSSEKSAQQIRQRKPRNGVRRRSALAVVVKYLGKETIGRLHDISVTGAAVDLQGPFLGAEGSFVRIECTELCFLEGRVRWLKNSRLGIEFDPSTNAVAKVQAYFKFFHREPLMQSV